MTLPNPYNVLGLQFGASDEEVKTAYRKLSKKFHPDLNEGDKFFEERFKEIQHAYEVLMNPSRKADYIKRFTEKNLRTKQQSTYTSQQAQHAGNSNPQQKKEQQKTASQNKTYTPPPKPEKDKSSNKVAVAILTIVACVAIGLIRGTLKKDIREYSTNAALSGYKSTYTPTLIDTAAMAPAPPSEATVISIDTTSLPSNLISGSDTMKRFDKTSFYSANNTGNNIESNEQLPSKEETEA